VDAPAARLRPSLRSVATAVMFAAVFCGWTAVVLVKSDDFVLATVRFLKQNTIDLDVDECFNIMNGMLR
jgi:hypothetical protein